MIRRRRALAASVFALNLNIVATAGVIFCEDSMACVNLPGYTCKNDRCVCEPSHSGLFPCVANAYGEKCRTNEDCLRIDDQMECSAAETRTCRCQRGLLWDEASRRCYMFDDSSFYSTYARRARRRGRHVSERAPPSSPNHEFRSEVEWMEQVLRINEMQNFERFQPDVHQLPRVEGGERSGYDEYRSIRTFVLLDFPIQPSYNDTHDYYYDFI